MPIALPNTIFYHIPKTGGTWVKNALDLFVKGYEKVWGKIPDEQGLAWGHATPDMVSIKKKEGKVSYAIMRHPVEWYRSLWVFRKKGKLGGPNDHFLKKGSWSSDFNKFIENLAERYPNGYYTGLYKRFKGKIDVWLRQENLTEDIILFLRKNGETFKDEDLRGYPHIRVARPHRKAQAVPSKKSLVLIKEMDKLIFKDFPEYAKN